jgi:four helix bundle protein
MGKLESYRDLEVWKVAMQLAKQVYQATEVMPKHEIYGLTSQILRACVSVPANIAEGVWTKSS